MTAAADPTRRTLLAAALASMVPAVPAFAAGAANPPSGLRDVLERPSSNARRAASVPMLRIARAGKRLVAVGERGVVLLSDDDGRQWRQAVVPVSVTLTGVQFTSERRGYAIGHSGVVLRTDDGGERWATVIDGRQVPALLTDADADAARQASADGPDKPWLALHFSDDDRGRVVGAFGLAAETTDAGKTWRSFARQLANPNALHLYAVARRNGQIWVAGEQGFVARSDDDGRSFAPVPTPYRGSFFALAATPDGSIFLAGLRGTLLQCGPDDSFRTIDSATGQGIVQLMPVAGGGLLLLDQLGRLRIGTGPQPAFKPLAATPERNWVGVAMAADGALIGASIDGVARLSLPPNRVIP